MSALVKYSSFEFGLFKLATAIPVLRYRLTSYGSSNQNIYSEMGLWVSVYGIFMTVPLAVAIKTFPK